MEEETYSSRVYEGELRVDIARERRKEGNISRVSGG